MNRRSVVLAGVLAGCALFSAGCATQIKKPDSAPQPSLVKFSEFKAVEFVPIRIAPSYADASANKRAAQRIEKTLVEGLNIVFPGMKRIEAGAADETPEARTLRIEPVVVEIKFIGGAARFWVGAMAGSSAVLIEVSFIDRSTGDVVAKPQFYRSAGAYSGGYSMGASDNMMLDEVARDIIHYAHINR